MRNPPETYSTRKDTTIPYGSRRDTRVSPPADADADADADDNVEVASQRADPHTRAATLALAAIGWVLQDESRAHRYLDLTGLDPDMLRAGLGDPRVLGSVLDFLANHEPDLVSAADALGVEPAELIAARKDLSR
ncbi:DUF3572 domain-containing protein [Erythrobacter sp.]|uniref:DUF3572 domain-containing protein n=1 Tax=Erythrobacter sp. TaxID=1042 RepID=UPI003C75B150